MDLNYLKQQLDEGAISKDNIKVVRRDGKLIDIHMPDEPITENENLEVMTLEGLLSEVFNLAPNFAPKV